MQLHLRDRQVLEQGAGLNWLERQRGWKNLPLRSGGGGRIYLFDPAGLEQFDDADGDRVDILRWQLSTVGEDDERIGSESLSTKVPSPSPTTLRPSEPAIGAWLLIVGLLSTVDSRFAVSPSHRPTFDSPIPLPQACRGVIISPGTKPSVERGTISRVLLCSGAETAATGRTASSGALGQGPDHVSHCPCQLCPVGRMAAAPPRRSTRVTGPPNGSPGKEQRGHEK